LCTDRGDFPTLLLDRLVKLDDLGLERGALPAGFCRRNAGVRVFSKGRSDGLLCIRRSLG
jgi:hypothetical protein